MLEREQMTAITDRKAGERMKETKYQKQIEIDIDLYIFQHYTIQVVDQVPRSLRELCSVPQSNFKGQSYLILISSPSSGVI
jgi:hypothetical protein